MHETPTKSSKTSLTSELKNAMTAEEPSGGTMGVAKDHEPVDPAHPKKSAEKLPEPAKTPTSHAAITHRSTDNKAVGNDVIQEDSTLPKPNQPKPTPESQKRKHPGKLDITAATGKQGAAASAVVASNQPEAETSDKASKALGQYPVTSSKQTDSPAASPIVKTAPRTLRVVQTPKTEGTPSTPFAASPLPPGVANRVPSRQPSIASIHPPGTPSSEQISVSDNISITSTSQSRANSPPPGSSKVGSAPLRAKTKNQLKKERQERAKAIEEEKAKVEEAVKPPVEEPAQEAIVSRKKKTKKEKEPKAKAKAVASPANVTPTTSQPSTPSAKPVPQEVPKPEMAQAEPKVSKASPPAKVAQTTQGPQGSAQSPRGASPPPASTPTAAQLIAELKASAPEIQKCIDSLFRVSNSSSFKSPPNISPKDLANAANFKSNFKVNLSKEEVDALLKGTVPAIHYGGEDGRVWDRGMVTPSGAHLRALTKELETRFLELEKAIREMPDEFRFRPKTQNEIKFPSIDLEAVKREFQNAGNRGASLMEQMVQDGSGMKKGAFLVDEANKYINEFILPPVTPPPSASNNVRNQPTSGPQPAAPEPAAPSVDLAERHLNEVRRFAEEKENALKKIIKKNKRLLGLS